jgi:3-oxoadipate enol-lactonase
MTTIHANGIDFNVCIDGPEGAPWITFSNSHATDLSCWDRQAALMADRFRVLRYDTRGHGGTEATEPPYDMNLLVSDVIALWDALGIERSHVVGLSLGGSTACGIAVQHPDRIASLFGSDCRAWSPTPHTWEPRIEAVSKDGMQAVLQSTMERWFTAPYLAQDPPELENIRRMIMETSVDGYIGGARALQGIDYRDRLGEVTCPCHFYAGDGDKGATPELVSAICDYIPHAKFDIIPDAGHITNIQNPDAFDRFLLAFFKNA